MVARIASNTIQIKPKNTTLQIGNTKVGLLIDPDSVCSILNESLATEVVNNSTLATWLTTALAQELNTFANEPIPVNGMMQAPIESNGWRIEDAQFVVVKDGLKPLIGRDLFEVLGVSITQTLCSNEGSMVNTITSQCPFKTPIANQFPQRFSRISRSKIDIVKSSIASNTRIGNFTKISNPDIKRVDKYPLIYNNELTVKLKKFLKKDT